MPNSGRYFFQQQHLASWQTPRAVVLAAVGAAWVCHVFRLLQSCLNRLVALDSMFSWLPFNFDKFVLSVVRLVTELCRSWKDLYIVSLIKNNGCLRSAFQPTRPQLLLSRRKLLCDLCREIILHTAELQPPLEGIAGAIELAGDPQGPGTLSTVLPHARNTLTNACHGKIKTPACKLTHTAH